MVINVLNRRIIMTPVLSTGGGSPFYVRAGNFGGTDNGSGVTAFTSDIGTATATRVILIATFQRNAAALTSVTVNGVGATAILTGGFETSMQFWQLTGAAAGSGNQTVTLNGVSSVETLSQVWYMDNLNSTTVKHTALTDGAATPCTTNINITAGDFLFAFLGRNAPTPSWSGSTDAPANTGTLTGPSDVAANADWTTVTTNASWSATATFTGGGNDQQLLVSFR
jgi:hypothetical protein